MHDPNIGHKNQKSSLDEEISETEDFEDTFEALEEIEEDI